MAEVLRYGLYHHILPRSVNEIALTATIEEHIYHIKKDVRQLLKSFIDAATSPETLIYLQVGMFTYIIHYDHGKKAS